MGVVTTATNLLETLLDQLPCFVVLLDDQHRVRYCNTYSSKTLGFKSSSHAIGVPILNFPCPVAEFHQEFEKQNNHVIEKQTELKILDIHPFVNNEVIVTLTTKKPFIHPIDSSISVSCHATPVTRSLLLKLSFAIVQSDKKYRPSLDVQRSYHYGKNFDPYVKLSSRELECLFYLVRGKSLTEIATCLTLSKRTVESYFENIKFKTGCTSKSELIEKALENNFIDFIPESFFTKVNQHISLLLSQE